MDAAHIYFEDNVSGATYTRLEQRNRLVEVCESGPPFQVLIVSEQSRLGRHIYRCARGCAPAATF